MKLNQFFYWSVKSAKCLLDPPSQPTVACLTTCLTGIAMADMYSQFCLHFTHVFEDSTHLWSQSVDIRAIIYYYELSRVFQHAFNFEILLYSCVICSYINLYLNIKKKPLVYKRKFLYYNFIYHRYHKIQSNIQEIII